ncbi:hypothetical protein BD408DRAFT_348243, partial [Parasitella parasitica]
PSRRDLAVQIPNLCNQHKLNVRYHHVAGMKSTEADSLSRSVQPTYEASIPRAFFNLLKLRWRRR